MNILKTLHDVDYDLQSFCSRFGFVPSRIKQIDQGKIKARKTTLERINEAMKKILTDEKIEYHPSYGYATKAQIERLKNIGICPERDQLLKKIK